MRQLRPDIVVLDTLLPLMSGFEVLEEIKNGPDIDGISVIMASDAGDLVYLREHAPLADGYVGKPIGLELLASIVSRSDRFGVAIVRT